METPYSNRVPGRTNGVDLLYLHVTIKVKHRSTHEIVTTESEQRKYGKSKRACRRLYTISHAIDLSSISEIHSMGTALA
jgi:hypothetical protein